MRAGTLRQRVTVQVVTLTQNTYGEPVASWSDVGTVWAEVLPAAGNERFVSAADQTIAELTHVVTMRYLDGLSPVNHRLVWNDQTLNIEHVMDIAGRSAMMKVGCREEIAEGSITAFAGEYSLDFSDADNSMYLGVV